MNYKILKKNWRCPYGEIDIIAKKDKTLFFFEVKTRVTDKKGKPYEAINWLKITHLKNSINYYLLKNKKKDYKLSLEVIGIVFSKNLEVLEFKHYQNILCY